MITAQDKANEMLISLLPQPVRWKDLMHNAQQIRKVRTNPASYRLAEFDMPEVGEFHD